MRDTANEHQAGISTSNDDIAHISTKDWQVFQKTDYNLDVKRQ